MQIFALRLKAYIVIAYPIPDVQHSEDQMCSDPDICLTKLQDHLHDLKFMLLARFGATTCLPWWLVPVRRQECSRYFSR